MTSRDAATRRWGTDAVVRARIRAWADGFASRLGKAACRCPL
ncbi:hypothetical protein LG3211_2390 [Lysobacter gummosus]|nr:hypothetical protein LG3211_2390 [Lysobacter gummosus]